jgi:membrane-bound serine protease (ClpP class)
MTAANGGVGRVRRWPRVMQSNSRARSVSEWRAVWARTRQLPAVLFAALLGALVVASPAGGQKAAESRPILLVDIKGVIGFVAAQHLEKALDKARAQDASLLIVRLDTPGGLVSSTRDMIQAILASRIPIAVYVAPSGARAASAGTYIAYASHLAAMAPATHLGAATPIALGVPGQPGSPPPSKPSPGTEQPSGAPDSASAAERKTVNDAVAYLRALAQLRGRNAGWAEKAVREGATLTASEARQEGVIEMVAPTLEDVVAGAHGRVVQTAAGEVPITTEGRRVIAIEPDWRHQLMTAITDPNIAFILLLIGIYGVLFEFMSPGAIGPGVVGAIALIVALTALAVLPVNYGGLALLVIGIALMVVEGLSPGFGIVGLGGVAAFILGSLFLFEPEDTNIDLAVSWPLIAGAAAVSVAFFAGLAGFALRARRRPVLTGAEELIGSTGEVVSWSQTEGHVRVHGEIWSARSDRPFLTGQKVRVVSRSGLTLCVEEAG